MERSAEFSPCRSYRYALTRIWNSEARKAMFIGLNPSTADENLDDPTIRRCIAFAQAWGYGGLVMCNLFALRATDPQEMLKHPRPIGEDNHATLCALGRTAGVVIAAWGTHGKHMSQDSNVRSWIGVPLHYLRLTKDGHPGHPLYLPKTLRPQLWS